MKYLVLVFAATLLASCVSVHRQTSSVFSTGGPCDQVTVNGKSGVACLDCSLCPKGQACWVQGVDGFFQKCPKVK